MTNTLQAATDSPSVGAACSTFLGQKQCHELKTWPHYFRLLCSGDKTFEARRDDRRFMAGDYLWLREWNPKSMQYTGDSRVYRVGFVLIGHESLVEGFVILSLLPVPDSVVIKVQMQFGS